MKLQISGLLLVTAVAYATIEAPEEFVSLAEMEDTLLRNLFRGYQKWVRPILHNNDTITVRFGLKISQLVDVAHNGGLPRPLAPQPSHGGIRATVLGFSSCAPPRKRVTNGVFPKTETTRKGVRGLPSDALAQSWRQRLLAEAFLAPMTALNLGLGPSEDSAPGASRGSVLLLAGHREADALLLSLRYVS
ncbi:hypothetical protein cypCar_00045006 [Cyprinus carpio]|nr:hypothetical protein cypCar_00045006 [Cyprinus carpio]